jgi:hypothetical protein
MFAMLGKGLSDFVDVKGLLVPSKEGVKRTFTGRNPPGTQGTMFDQKVIGGYAKATFSPGHQFSYSEYKNKTGRWAESAQTPAPETSGGSSGDEARRTLLLRNKTTQTQQGRTLL